MDESDLVARSHWYYCNKTPLERAENDQYILENIENLTHDEKCDFYLNLRKMVSCGLIYIKLNLYSEDYNYGLTERGRKYAPRLRKMNKERRRDEKRRRRHAILKLGSL